VELRAQADASMPASNNNVNSHYTLQFLTTMECWRILIFFGKTADLALLLPVIVA